MEEQLAKIRKSYDQAIEYGSQGIDLYKALPDDIINDPDYVFYQKAELANTLSDSGRKEIRDYLAPSVGQSFVDLGCCLNLMFRGYAAWPSTYYGVDISEQTIQLLKDFTATNKLSVGALHCGSIDATPFATDFFDIGACIGVLEYFEKEYVKKALQEIQRIMKPGSRLVLDVPAASSPEYRIASMIEAHLERPDQYDLSTEEFEALLHDFNIEKVEKVGPMLQYFLTC